jgi:hypothetical protein
MEKKLTLEQLKKQIKEIIIEQMWGATFDMNKIKSKMLKNPLKSGVTVLKYPTEKEVYHEAMRINTLYKTGHSDQYLNRFTKINNPKKMYAAYLACLEWKKEFPEDKEDMLKFAHIARTYLKKWGYENLPVGKGNQIRLNIKQAIN